METSLYIVVTDDEISFVSFSEEKAGTFAENAASDDIAVTVAQVTVPSAMLMRIPRLAQRYSNYSPSELNPVYESGRKEHLLLDGSQISIEYLKAVQYMNEEYIYIDTEDMWYLVDGEELILPDFDIEQDVEAYADAEWRNPALDNAVVCVINDHDFSRMDIYNACVDYLTADE